MVVDQSKSRKKVSGGLYKRFKKKRLHNMGNLPTLTKIGERKVKVKRMKGGSLKFSLLDADFANVFDGEKYVKAKIITVVENPANRHYIRRNILTKGTIIKTEIGDAKVTSRPGQEAIINAILIKK